MPGDSQAIESLWRNCGDADAFVTQPWRTVAIVLLMRQQRLVTLLGTCAVVLALCEVGAMWATRHLKSRSSVPEDVSAAVALTGPGSVLVVGNSLVLHGIDVPAVERAMGSGYTATKVAIIDSGYLDWLYGLASLFDRGSRPDVVVLAISPAQFVADHPPNGNATHWLWTVPNLLRYTLESRPGLTSASDHAVEHFSEFFAIRSRLRQNAKRVIVPGYEGMSRQLFTSLASAPDTIRDEAIAEERLRVLDSACAARRARFVYLLIPTNTPEDRSLERTLERAGEQAGVSVLVPVSNGSVDATWLSDGYHLNSRGAATFSTRAGVALSAELADRRARRMQ